ncbi:hypothetical protein AAE478_010396 [Parahypoxylon ruwenzoriense]
MAQDESEPSRLRGPPPGATAPPEHVNKPQIYEIFHSPKSESRVDGPTEGQANPSPPSIKEGIQSIKSDDFLSVHKIPCARQGFMTGIASGAVVGMGRYLKGGPVPKAANWAFGAFFIGCIAQWEYCRAQRSNERAAIARVVEVMDRKQAEKKAKAVEEARLKEEAAERARQEAVARRSWYKFW